jgi:hypothetical protein
LYKRRDEKRGSVLFFDIIDRERTLSLFHDKWHPQVVRGGKKNNGHSVLLERKCTLSHYPRHGQKEPRISPLSLGDLQASAVVVWVVDPVNRNVVEYRQGGPSRTYAEDDTLTVPDLIPGFALLVREALQE